VLSVARSMTREGIFPYWKAQDAYKWAHRQARVRSIADEDAFAYAVFAVVLEHVK